MEVGLVKPLRHYGAGTSACRRRDFYTSTCCSRDGDGWGRSGSWRCDSRWGMYVSSSRTHRTIWGGWVRSAAWPHFKEGM